MESADENKPKNSVTSSEESTESKVSNTKGEGDIDQEDKSDGQTDIASDGENADKKPSSSNLPNDDSEVIVDDEKMNGCEADEKNSKALKPETELKKASESRNKSSIECEEVTSTSLSSNETSRVGSSQSSPNDEKMDVDETVSSTDTVKTTDSEKSPLNNCSTENSESKEGSSKGAKHNDSSEMDVDMEDSSATDDVSRDEKSSPDGPEASGSSTDTSVDKSASEEKMSAQNSATDPEDKTSSNCTSKESAEKAVPKEKSMGIDAIAKKLGQQVKVNNEGSKDDTEEKKESTSSETQKANHVSESNTESKASESSADKQADKHKGDGSEKKKKKRSCEECKATKNLKFQVLFQSKVHYMCSDTCFQSYKMKQKQHQKKKEPERELPKPPQDICSQCKKLMQLEKGFYPMLGEIRPLCSEECLANYHETYTPKKKCSQCKRVIDDEGAALTWETMDFCNEDCLGKYQSFLGSHCTCCQSPVQQTSLGKYCVCFGSDIRQFCSGSCLEEFKKGLKVCSFCQKDLSAGTEGFLAPVGDKGQFKDFCTQQCMERYENMNNKAPSPGDQQQCTFCCKSGSFKIKPKFKGIPAVLCSDICVSGYLYLHKIKKRMCDVCFKFFEPELVPEFRLQYEGVVKYYCTKSCMTLFVLSHRKIVPCSWCKVKKYNFDMIEKLDSSHQVQTYCSLNCISLYRVSVNATSAKSIRCDNCSKSCPAQYHLTMSDGSIRNFCTYQCVIHFQNQFTNVPALTTPSANRQSSSSLSSSSSSSTTTATPASPATAVSGVKSTAASHTPVISSVVSLAGSTPRPVSSAALAAKLVSPKIAAAARQASPALTIITTKPQPPPQPVNASAAPSVNANASSSSTSGGSTAAATQVIREVIVKPPAPKSLKNKAVLCKPVMQTKGISCRPHPCHKAVQTDDGPLPAVVPIPVPVFVPTPVHMFSRPVPCPIPFPIPIPVPILLPTTKDSPSQVLKHLKDIQDNLPSNPLEGEMLMMAEKAAESGDKGAAEANSKAHFGGKETQGESSNIPESEQDSHDDVLDVESAMPSGIAPVLSKEEDVADGEEDYYSKEGKSHGKRSSNKSRSVKRPRVDVVNPDDSDSYSSMPVLEDHNSSVQQETQDTNLRLKHCFGVNAWKHWVLQKNSQLEKGSQAARKFKPFKTDLLQLPPDELNYSLSLFVKEVRKPSGEEYAPASIYYLCLGIQQYLFENGRIDNIFTDPYYEKFTDCLHDVLLSQDDILPVEGYFISRIEEEVLWESKQLGAHSPHVLLNTLMFFNTKYFNLKTIDEHLHLSFSHITKHWRKTSVKSGPRNVVLRYYPPVNKGERFTGIPPDLSETINLRSSPNSDQQLKLQARLWGARKWQRRRKEENGVYEQNENLENPLRCPVKLYEFYLSKCPESVKTRNDVFYLYPERSCVPDSPVWYSTQPMGRDMIAKMLQRIKTVREVYET